MRFFDANVMVGSTSAPFEGTRQEPEAVHRRLRECGIERALVYHASALESHPALGNSRLAEDLLAFADARAAWVLLPFSTEELGPAARLRQELKRHAVASVLAYPAAHRYSNAEWCCGDLYSLVEDMRIPLFTRMDPSDFTVNELSRLLSAHPGIPVVLREVGYALDRSLYRLLERHGNLFLETGRYLVFAGLEAVARRFGAGRLIFGSGAPVYSPGAAVAAVLLSSLSAAEKELVAHANLERLIEGIRYDA